MSLSISCRAPSTELLLQRFSKEESYVPDRMEDVTTSVIWMSGNPQIADFDNHNGFTEGVCHGTGDCVCKGRFAA